MSRYLRVCLACLVFSLLFGRLVAKLSGLAKEPSGEQPTVTTINDVFAQVGRKAPGFGGMFIDEEKDKLYVYMVDAGPESSAIVDKAINDVFGLNRPSASHLEILQGQYSFLQ